MQKHEKEFETMLNAHGASEEYKVDLDNQHLNGLGGWLILVCIGLIINTIYFLSGFAEFVPFFKLGWFDATDFILAEFGVLGVLAAYYWVMGLMVITMAFLLLIYEFCNKRSTFPMHWIIINTGSFIYLIFGAWLLDTAFQEVSVEEVDAIIKSIPSTFLAIIIWGTYMFKSKRVKATFTK